LTVEGLTIEVHRDGTWRPVVRDVSFVIGAGERVAMVGESGSGKSLTALALGRLLPLGARMTSGRLSFFGIDLGRCSPAQIRALRGRDIGFVFQDPTSALDPTMNVGRQIMEVLSAHGIGHPRSQRERASAMLSRVGIPGASSRMDEFPHQFSGGMRQRAMIAAALVAGPRLLVADEPTSALDVTIQAQILDLIDQLSTEMGLAVLFITHDLSVAREVADRVVVLYAGRVLEDGPTDTLLGAPHHPYTDALVGLAPRLGSGLTAVPIPGMPIAGWLAGDGCPFAPRCQFAEHRCRATPWALADVAGNPAHRSACIIPPEERRVHSRTDLQA
jgi:oligopeptide/dipeptide ABC transporter ATP-binding protein